MFVKGFRSEVVKILVKMPDISEKPPEMGQKWYRSVPQMSPAKNAEDPK